MENSNLKAQILKAQQQIEERLTVLGDKKESGKKFSLFRFRIVVIISFDQG